MQDQDKRRLAASSRRRGDQTRRWLCMLALLLPILLFAALLWPSMFDRLLFGALPALSPAISAVIRALAGCLLLLYLLKIGPRAARCGRRREPEFLDSRADKGGPESGRNLTGNEVPSAQQLSTARTDTGRTVTAGRAGFRPNLPLVCLRPASGSAVSARSVAGFKRNLRLSDLEGKDLEGASLRCGALHGANLRAASLGWASLQRADLSFTDLRQAFLAAADLRGADLTGANLRGACLAGAKLQGADLGLADLRGADLRVANLQGAILVSALLQGCNFQGAIMKGVDLRRSMCAPGQLRWAASLAGAWMPDGRLHG